MGQGGGTDLDFRVEVGGRQFWGGDAGRWWGEGGGRKKKISRKAAIWVKYSIYHPCLALIRRKSADFDRKIVKLSENCCIWSDSGSN